MKQRKSCLSSPSLQTGLSPPHAAGDPVCAAWSPRGLLAHTAGAPIDTPANTSCALQTRNVAPAPDCPGSRHLPAAWRAASAAAGYADTFPPHNISDRELADTAEMPCRKRHTPLVHRSAPRPDNLSGVRYRSAVNRLVTNSRGSGSIDRNIQRVPFAEQTQVHSRERQGPAVASPSLPLPVS
jgi:hypothetical protein